MRVYALVLFTVCVSLSACGKPEHREPSPLDRGAQKQKPADDSSSEDSRYDARNTSTIYKTEPVAPTAAAEDKPSPLVTEGHLQTDLPEYKIPDSVRERLEGYSGYRQEFFAPKKSEFDVVQQQLTIDATKKTVTFSGVLQVKGKTDEAFALACKIDTSASPWVCRDMAPTDKKLAAQKRFQGTFKCLDAYVCERVGVALWVVIDGKLQEPKLFQAQGFQLRRATSGDVDEEDFDSGVESSPEPAPAESRKFQDRLAQEPQSKNEKAPKPPTEKEAEEPLRNPKLQPRPVIVAPSPTPAHPAPITPRPVAMSDQELKQLLADPEAAIEISEPMTMPNPAVGKYSVPGIEKLRTEIGRGGVKVQAVGWHNSGSLQKASEFPASGPGFISRDHGKKDFATELTVNLIGSALGRMARQFPGRAPVVIGNVANRTGGRLANLSGRYHASHQTGLDADVGLPSTRPENSFFSALGGGRGKVSERFDVERFWYFAKQVACAENKPVIAMFLDRRVKSYVCNYVRDTAHENMNDACVVKALQSLVHEPGHDNHVHVRLRCPENSACQNSWVTLVKGTGC